MSAALVAHEPKYAKHGRETVAAIALLLSPHVWTELCASAQDAIERDAQARLQEGRDLDGELDRRTGHGATEGVAIPW